MREFNLNAVTPQDKIINVSDKFGNTGIKKMQGTTVSLYDTLPLDGRNEFRFFEGSTERNFPFSNTGADGNKLGVGSSMIISRAYINIFTYSPPTFSQVTVLPAEAVLGEFSFEIGNSQVIKQLTGLDFFPQFNNDARANNNFVIEFDTQISIQPMLEFVAIYRVQLGTIFNPTSTNIRLTLEGTGSILAPRTTF
jgi:hypothetical protein